MPPFPNALDLRAATDEYAGARELISRQGEIPLD